MSSLNPSSKTRRSDYHNRRHSNDLSGSVRIGELRRLQQQLTSVIKNASKDEEEGWSTTHSLDDSTHSTRSVPSSSWVTGRGSNFSIESVERVTLLGDDDHDIESGSSNLNTSGVYRPQLKSPLMPQILPEDDEDEPIITYRMGNLRSSAMRKYPSRRTISELSSNRDDSEILEDPKGSENPDEAKDDIPADIVAAVNFTASVRNSLFSGDTGDTNPSAESSGTIRRRSRGRFALRGASTRQSAGSASPARRFTHRISRVKRQSASKYTKQKIDASSSKREIKKSRPTRRTSYAPTYDFLQIEKEELDEGSLRPGAKWWHGVFIFSLISMLACVITLWAPYPMGARMPSAIVATTPWSDGCQGLKSCICHRKTVCADDLLSMIFLTIARSSAWFDYPLYMLLFMSKANNLNNFLQHTALRCWINFSDYHHVHSLFGIVVGLESTSHAFFHIVRWARRKDDIQLLWNSQTGLTGLIAIILCPFIVLPMTVPYLKKQMSFEWRKGLHYLSIVWGAALMCHAPARIFWLIGIPFFIYAADKMVEGFSNTHLVESAHFQRLGDTSCLISFANPPGFGKQNSAYVYLMLPWLSKYQFHAFTVFPDTKANHSSICIHKCGDWTQKLMKTITTPTHKPAFVVGPFLSPFSSPAMDSEHLVAVASGIGVTPAISLIKQYSSTSRRLNLIWICRDAGLVEHFLQNVDFGSDGYTLIYYTGRDRELILQDDLPPNVFIFKGRPNLERTICGIITGIATGEGLPEELHNKVLTQTPADMRSKLLLEKALSIYTMDQLYAHTVKASAYHSEGIEPNADTVNYQGVLSTMRHLLGDDYDLVTDKITNNFEKVKTNGDFQMDFNDFEFFFKLMLEGSNTQELSSMASVKIGLQRMSNCRDTFSTSMTAINRLSGVERRGNGFEIKQHLNGDGKFSARNWNMLYCGGSQPVLDQLKAFKRKFGIALSVEKFDW